MNPAASFPYPRAPLKPGAIEAVLRTDEVSEATRAALDARLAWAPPDRPECFGAADFITLDAICGRLIPQPPGDRRVDLAARLDWRLAQGTGDGWRHASMPPDRQALVLGVKAVDWTALAMFKSWFRFLAPAGQDLVLAAVQQGTAIAPAWQGLPPARFFELLLSRLAEIYYAHPHAQALIGYIGMADAHGFSALGLGARDPVEQAASDAPV